jgi:radical S-adenosyl methionine domain-containing protein 2
MSKDPLSADDWKTIIRLLKPYCQRINFAGGEPLLDKPLLSELILFTHRMGLISTIITNGYYLDWDWLTEYGKYIKAIGISCDSSNEETQEQLGRGNGNHVSSTLDRFKLINAYNLEGGTILTKLNTVVNRLNYKEDMTEFVLKTGVKRWKVFQLLEIIGENKEHSANLIITREEFEHFTNINKKIESNGVDFVPEDASELIDTYVMVNPEGRLFSNRNHVYKQSDPIPIVGVEKALAQIDFDQQNLSNIDRMFL